MKFSKRAEDVPKSEIRDMMHRAYKKGAIMLAQGTPGFDTPEHIREAAIEAMHGGFNQYSPLVGYPELRKAIAEKLNNFNKIPAEPENVLVTAGAMEAIAASCLATLEKGDEAIAIGPVFSSYSASVNFSEAGLKEVPLEGENLTLNSEALKTTISDKTKMLILNTPQNPTGRVFSKKEIEKVAEIAKDHNLLVLTDEIYEHIIFEGEHHSIASFPGMFERTISISGFSKTYAMTGWRLGYLSAPREIVDQITKIHTHLVIAAPSISQRAGITALKGPQDCVEEMRKGYEKNRDYLIPELGKLGFKTFNPKGAYYAFSEVSEFGMSGKELAEKLLEEANVAVVPGDEFGPLWKNYVRMTFSRPMQELKKAVEKIRPVLT